MAGNSVSPIPVAPVGLSSRAQRFVEVDGIRVPRQDIRCHRGAWIERRIPAAEIDRAADFQDRWGGLALPPARPRTSPFSGIQPNSSYVPRRDSPNSPSTASQTPQMWPWRVSLSAYRSRPRWSLSPCA